MEKVQNLKDWEMKKETADDTDMTNTRHESAWGNFEIKIEPFDINENDVIKATSVDSHEGEEIDIKHIPEPISNFVCIVCGLTFNLLDALENHLIGKHAMGKDITPNDMKDSQTAHSDQAMGKANFSVKYSAIFPKTPGMPVLCNYEVA